MKTLSSLRNHFLPVGDDPSGHVSLAGLREGEPLSGALARPRPGFAFSYRSSDFTLIPVPQSAPKQFREGTGCVFGLHVITQSGKQ